MARSPIQYCGFYDALCTSTDSILCSIRACEAESLTVFCVQFLLVKPRVWQLSIHCSSPHPAKTWNNVSGYMCLLLCQFDSMREAMGIAMFLCRQLQSLNG